jgi:hypothetical protein
VEYFCARENGYPAHVLLISRREGVSCNPGGIGARVRHDCSDGVGYQALINAPSAAFFSTQEKAA